MRAPATRLVAPIRRPLLRTAGYSTLSHLREFVDVHPEVQEAFASNNPIVALETTLITHGFRYPRNYELGLDLENIVRQNGSIPATIGFIGGRIKIGMDKKDIERLADKKNNPTVVKVSRRDIGPVIASGLDGGTTCSATTILAAMAGIKVFATGGLGGVHRGGESTMDISADLQDLSRCPVGLVSSGVKSILDIGRQYPRVLGMNLQLTGKFNTQALQETLGVPVISYANNRNFPAFFSRSSGFKAPWDVSDPLSAAKILYAQHKLGLQHGALIAVPIPEDYEKAGAEIQKLVDQAVTESEQNGVSKRGKEVTPWLLDRIAELSGGESLENNAALLRNTALVVSLFPLVTCLPDTNLQRAQQAKLIVVGCAAVDLTATADSVVDCSLSKHSTTPGQVSFSLGGVARNVAEASHRVIASQQWNLSSMLVAPIGNDAFGAILKSESEKLGMKTTGLIETEGRTAICNMLLDHEGNLMSGVADMEITKSLKAAQVIPLFQRHKPKIVALDGNLSPDTISTLATHCIQQDIPVFFEPTSVIKSTSVLPAVAANLDVKEGMSAPIAFISPNRLELAHLYRFASADTYSLTNHPAWWSTIDKFSIDSNFHMGIQRLSRISASSSGLSGPDDTLSFFTDQGTVQMAVNLLPFFQHIIIKCGEKGVLIVMRTRSPSWLQTESDIDARFVVAHGESGESVVVCHCPALEADNIVNVTGAGDSFVGALLAQLAHDPTLLEDRRRLLDIIQLAQQAAVLTLQSPLAVSPLISFRKH
ncbi:hypothetical protein AX16_009670 [Volvariella volvacea WC 439]|nr:hypothetical protein AX16_009670 [Volvariella volvacea WC 439]